MRFALAAVLVSLVACSDDAPSDPIDAAIDTPPGPCGADVQFTGEYLEWTWTTTSGMGIWQARFTVFNAPTRTDLSEPNGRVEFCIVANMPSRITVTQAEHNPAVVLADPAVFGQAGVYFSARGLKLTERTANYQALGEASFDASRAHVLATNHGGPAQFTLAGAPVAYAYNNETWAVGNTGDLVLFPNVPVGNGTAALSGSFVGPHEVELVAGSLTIVPTR